MLYLIELSWHKLLDTPILPKFCLKSPISLHKKTCFFLPFQPFLPYNYKLVNFGLKCCIILSYDEKHCWISIYCLHLVSNAHFFTIFFLHFLAFFTIWFVPYYFKLFNFGLKCWITLCYDENNCWIPIYYPNLVSCFLAFFAFFPYNLF